MRIGLTLFSFLALCGVLFAEEPKTFEPTYANVSYGPHPRNVVDFWKAEGEGPRPLLVHIHGGGWVAGDKKQTEGSVKPYLAKGISVAAINYRLTAENPLPAPVHDAARAIQFLRSKASEWNIRKDRIAVTGGSAGACTSMWLLFHDDLADPNSKDPVAHESTRVTAAAAIAGQTSIDPKVIEGWLGPKVLEHRMIWMAVGEPDMASALKNYDSHKNQYAEFSPYNHVDKSDPPLLMIYRGSSTLPSESGGHGIHHPMYGLKLKEKCDQAGTECHILLEGGKDTDKFGIARDFLFAKLLAP